MGSLLLQCRDEGARRRVEEEYLLPVPHEWCTRNEEVLARGTDAGLVGVVLDTTDEQGKSTAPAVRGLRKTRKDLPVVIWCGTGEASLVCLPEMGRAGADAIVFRRPGAFEQRALTQFFPRESFPYEVWIEQALERRVPEASRTLVRHCIHPDGIQLHVHELARGLGRSPRTLADQLRRAHLPSTSSLQVWGRLLAAVWALSHSRLPVERIAQQNGFASAGSLRAALKHRTTDLPRDLRAPEGFTWTLRCFEHELARLQRRAVAG
jgi:AraC-like DNA-binding protein